MVTPRPRRARPVRSGVELQQEGEVLFHNESRVGIRTLELDQSPDPEEPGTRFFRFVLNGVSIYARGADWMEDFRQNAQHDAAPGGEEKATKPDWMRDFDDE